MRHIHDVERLLRAEGFAWQRTSGSHHIWRHVQTGRTVCLAAHGRRTFSRRELRQVELDIRRALHASMKG